MNIYSYFEITMADFFSKISRDFYKAICKIQWKKFGVL